MDIVLTVKKLIAIEQTARRVYGVIQAARKANKPTWQTEHDRVRNEAEAIYRRAVTRWLALAERTVLTESDEDVVAVWGVYIGEVSKATYIKTISGMAKVEGLTPVQISMATASEQEAESFAEARQKLTNGFAENALAKLRKADPGDKASPGARRKAISEVGEQVEAFEGKRLAETESQVAYGSAQMRVITAAGFKSKSWVTMGDKKVRTSHSVCEEQGAIPMAKTFHNGLLYPGDPNGSAEEVCGCRCWLVGGAR